MKSFFFFSFGLIVGAALLVFYELTVSRHGGRSRDQRAVFDLLHIDQQGEKNKKRPFEDANETVDCQPSQRWIEFPNTNVPNGRWDGDKTLHFCQASCLKVPGCNGLDWNPNGNPAGGQCWLSGSWSGQMNNGTSKGVTHYVLEQVKCDERDLKYSAENVQSPVEECTSSWKASERTQAFGGIANPVKSISECQKACLAHKGCTGINWTSDTADIHQCWLTGAWVTGWNRGAAPGVTHFEMESKNCRNSNKL